MELLFLMTTALFFSIMGALALWVAFAAAFFIKSRKPAVICSEKPPVTVIIPAYNEEAVIANCIKAVKASEYPELEIFVVDDGSTDSTKDIAQSFGVTVLEQVHSGKVAALNLGISKAKHDFLVTIDADMFIESAAISELMKYFSTGVAAVSGICKIHNKNGILGLFQNVEYIYLYFMREAFSFLFKTAPGVCGPLTCFRKKPLEEVGGFSSKTSAEDFDVSLHLFKAGYKSVVAPGAIGSTVAPASLQSLCKQRLRWSKGILQSIFLHKRMVGRFPATYILIIHLFWFIVALFSIVLIPWNVAYWLPLNSATPIETALYFFYWFSFAGIVRMVYMIPVWGINIVYIFGIISGILTIILMSIALKRYGEGIGLRSAFGLFFYFPYVLVLNFMLVGSVLFYIVKKGKGTFVK